MKKIENIFSKSKTTSIPKTPIIIDTRETSSLIYSELKEKYPNTILQKLEIGDYKIQDTVIERKTFSDFVSSILNKRLFDQLREIKKYPKHFLILENFDYNYHKFKIHENAIRGTILSITTEFQIPIIYTQNQNDTIKFLILTANRYNNPKQNPSIRQTKTKLTPIQQKQFILEGFPGIGPSTTKTLLKNFPTLKKIFNSTEEELQNYLNKKTSKIFYQLLNNTNQEGSW
jgi:ERCC4-type nuclease